MLDTGTKKPVKVETAPETSPYIRLSKYVQPRVVELLTANKIHHWTLHAIVTVNDGPPMMWITLGHKTNPQQVQDILDQEP